MQPGDETYILYGALFLVIFARLSHCYLPPRLVAASRRGQMKNPSLYQGRSHTVLRLSALSAIRAMQCWPHAEWPLAEK